MKLLPSALTTNRITMMTLPIVAMSNHQWHLQRAETTPVPKGEANWQWRLASLFVPFTLPWEVEREHNLLSWMNIWCVHTVHLFEQRECHITGLDTGSTAYRDHGCFSPQLGIYSTGYRLCRLWSAPSLSLTARMLEILSSYSQLHQGIAHPKWCGCAKRRSQIGTLSKTDWISACQSANCCGLCASRCHHMDG